MMETPLVIHRASSMLQGGSWEIHILSLTLWMQLAVYRSVYHWWLASGLHLKESYFEFTNKLGSQFVKNHNLKKNSQLVIEMPLFNSSLLIPLFVNMRKKCSSTFGKHSQKTFCQVEELMSSVATSETSCESRFCCWGGELAHAPKTKKGSLPETETNSFAPEH